MCVSVLKPISDLLYDYWMMKHEAEIVTEIIYIVFHLIT